MGGITAYLRRLSEELERSGDYRGKYGCIYPCTESVSRFQATPWPILPLANVPFWRFLQSKIFSRIASRPKLYPLLRGILYAVLPDRSLKKLVGMPEVIHFTGTGWDILGFRMLGYARKIRARFTVLPALHPGSWGDDTIDVHLYRQAEGVFCLSDHEGAHLVQRGLDPGQILRTGLPPMCLSTGDADRFRNRLGIGERPVVLFLGRRDAGKGFPALLQAWPRVLAAMPDAVLALAGPGGQDFKALAESLPKESFRDLGMPDEQGKADALAACDVFCLPSAHESFGLVYIEAWSYGKPVICGTAPACRELVEDGVTGLWSTQDDEVLSGKILTLLGIPTARTMGEAGRRRQQTKYSAEAMVQAHLDGWKKAPNQPPGGPTRRVPSSS
jgi:glycosyltransferase involved in cell wall biosynthesis